MVSLLRIKRKAEDNLQTHPERRSRVDKPSPVVIGRVSEEGSINSIIQNNNPRRLYVKPIAWTSDHLQLLECKFDFENAHLKRKRKPLRENSYSCVRDNAPGQAGRSKLSEDAVHVKKTLLRPTVLSAKRSFVKWILDAYDIRPQGSPYLSFHFNLQHAARLPTESLFASSAGPSSLAYITFDTIQDIRNHHFRGRKGACHPFLLKGEEKYQKDISLDRLAEDPYLVAILIALAQDQRRHQQRNGQDADTTKDAAFPETGPLSCEGIKVKSPSTTQSFKVQVLAVYGATAKHFYVYTAIISAEFLDKFDKPWQYSPNCPVVVKYRRIAVKGEWSLEKLHRVLCTGSCKFCAGNSTLSRHCCS